MDDEVWFFDIVDKMENRGRNEKYLTPGGHKSARRPDNMERCRRESALG